MSVRSSQGAATEAGSSPAAAARPRFTRGDAALLAGGAALTALLAAAAVGGVTGGLIGHFHGGMSRKDVKELGEMLDAGDAALIVIGRDKLDEQLQKAGLRAQKQVEKELNVDAKELDKQLAEAEKEMDKS